MSRSPHLPLDSYCRGVLAEQPDAIVAWWLMASYLYYCTDETLLTDGCFDELTATLLARWDAIEHPHKRLIDRGMLEAGSGHNLAEADYPNITKDAAEALCLRGPEAVPEATAILEADRMFTERERAKAAEPPPAPPAAATAHQPQQGDLFG